VRSAFLGFASFCSGLAALIWQVVWIRRLAEAFGHTAFAVHVVLATFFLGLGIGAWLVGRRADRSGGPIAIYCGLEILIAAAGLAFAPLSDAVERFYLSFAPAEWPLSSSLLFKAAACVALLAIPTLAMGGTLPALLRHAVRHREELGVKVGWLYGWNTIGASLGAATAVLLLLPRWGVPGTAAAAAGLNLGAALLAWLARKRDSASFAGAARGPDPVPAPVADARTRALLGIAVVSGFVTVGLEVLWTRALATRFLNTVYSFATILTVFLCTLGVASIATAWLDRRGWARRPTLGLVLAVGGTLGLASVLVLGRTPASWAGGTGTSVSGFFLREILDSVLVMSLPILVLGLAFPLLVRLLHAEIGSVGSETGRVYLANTVGSVAAPLLLGFVALPSIGLRSSLCGLSWIGVVCGLLLALPGRQGFRGEGASRWTRRGTFAAVALAATLQLLLPAEIRLWRDAPADVLVDYREGVAASVAVLDEAGGDRVLKLNNEYVLGGLRGAQLPRREGLVPLLLHGRPASALFIGLGTGGSAGAAAAVPEIRVDALEIIPEVVEMLPWFDESNAGLARRMVREPERIRVLTVDGRHYVRATPRRYDLVVGDLFLPYRAGEGAMYTREHVAAVRAVLSPGGLFCQWLPLYQFRDSDLRVVVATFCDVFPRVEAFWLQTDPAQPVLGLVGSDEDWSIDPRAIQESLGRPDLAALWADAAIESLEGLLAGWITEREALLEWSRGAPIETRDRPTIEYSAPRNTILSPEDPSGANIARILGCGRSPVEAGPFGRCSPELRGRIAAHQRAFAALLRWDPSTGSDGRLAACAAALREAPEWELLARSIKAIGRQSLDRGDLPIARRAAEILRGHAGQEHAGFFLSALVARREGAVDLARRLVAEALRHKPDHKASLELARDLGDPLQR